MKASKEIRRAVKHLTIAAGDVENLEAEIRTLKAKAAEVVAELRERAEQAYDHRENYANNEAADLVAEKLGVKS